MQRVMEGLRRWEKGSRSSGCGCEVDERDKLCEG